MFCYSYLQYFFFAYAPRYLFAFHWTSFPLCLKATLFCSFVCLCASALFKSCNENVFSPYVLLTYTPDTSQEPWCSTRLSLTHTWATCGRSEFQTLLLNDPNGSQSVAGHCFLHLTPSFESPQSTSSTTCFSKNFLLHPQSSQPWKDFFPPPSLFMNGLTGYRIPC